MELGREKLSSEEELATAAAAAVHPESALSKDSNKNSNFDTQPASFTLKVITWNINGLAKENLMIRTEAVCEIIKTEQADIVFLQEVVSETAAYILEKMSDYRCFFGGQTGYFVGTLLKKSSITFIDSEVIEFPGTKMSRNLLKANVTYKGTLLCLLNSHLESLSKCAEERKNQLKIVFRNILNTPVNKTVIFGGDTNLEEKELTALGGLPAGIEDVWVTCGSRKECAYTFDLLRNDSLVLGGKFKPRCRYDRVYVRRSSPSQLKPIFLGLIGLERISPHQCFPSDHFGVLCHFEME